MSPRDSHERASLSALVPLAATAGRDSFMHSMSLRHSGQRELRIAFQWQGPKGAPVVIVAGGISAHRHAGGRDAFPEAGWWPAQVGPGLAIDTCRFRVVGIDWLGAQGDCDFAIDTADQADALAAVLDHLPVAKVTAFIGCSYGAMVGLQFAVRHNARVERLLAISGADRPHPYASSLRAVQRGIARLGRSEAGRREALSLARQLAMLTYRTPEEFAERFAAPVELVGGQARCAAEDYLDRCGSRYVACTSPTAFLRLSESIDLHAVAAQKVTVATTLVGVDEDRLVPAASLVELAGRLPNLVRLHLLQSRYGHDAFLKEDDKIGAIIRATLGPTLEETGGAVLRVPREDGLASAANTRSMSPAAPVSVHSPAPWLVPRTGSGLLAAPAPKAVPAASSAMSSGLLAAPAQPPAPAKRSAISAGTANWSGPAIAGAGA